jgi:hypothetical protein
MKRLLPFFVVFVAGVCFGQSQAVIVVGAPGSPMYQRHYEDRAKRFEAVLTKLGGSVTTVSNKPASEILAAVQKAAGDSKSEQQFVLVLIGHGQVGDGGTTLATPGADLQMAALAKTLEAVKCRSQVVLNFASNAGDALPLLAVPGRVNIAGSSAQQVNDNDFAEFALQELEANPKSPLLDVYNHAVEKWAKWTVRQKMVGEEGKTGWNVEGKESAAIFRKLYDAGDVPADRRYVASEASDKPDDANPPLLPEPKKEWTNRRVITENPSIDDAGSKTPVSALSEKGFAAVATTAEQPIGKVAARTVLGTP